MYLVSLVPSGLGTRLVTGYSQLRHAGTKEEFPLGEATACHAPLVDINYV